MKLLISAPELTKPTYQTIEEYSTKFLKLDKFLTKTDKKDHELRIAVRKEHDIFAITCELHSSPLEIVSNKHRDLRRGLDVCFNQLKAKIHKQRDKRLDLHKFKKRVGDFKERMIERFRRG